MHHVHHIHHQEKKNGTKTKKKKVSIIKEKKSKQKEMKVKNMQALGFEPRPPERLQPECSALDRLGHACLQFTDAFLFILRENTPSRDTAAQTRRWLR